MRGEDLRGGIGRDRDLDEMLIGGNVTGVMGKFFQHGGGIACARIDDGVADAISCPRGLQHAVRHSGGEPGLGPVQQIGDGIGPGRARGGQLQRRLAIQHPMRALHETHHPDHIPTVYPQGMFIGFAKFGELFAGFPR